MPSVAVIGTRGYPSYYGGFETAVRKLATYLAEQDWDVTVYGRPNMTVPTDPDRDPRVHSIQTKGVESKSLSTLSYGLTAALDAARRRPDVALVMNVANGFWLPILKRAGVPTLVNVDGIEWERAKWGRIGRKLFHSGAVMTAKFADGLVYDSLEIRARWMDEFRTEGTFIPYGGDSLEAELPLEPGLTHRRYVLMVARLVPENSIQEFLHAAKQLAESTDVVIVGSSGHGGALEETVRNLTIARPRVRWLGQVSDDRRLHSLWQHAGVYFHGHSVGGTNPALVQAMACGAPTVARDTVYNREVLSHAGEYAPPRPDLIAQRILGCLSDPDKLERMSRAGRRRASEDYSWAGVNQKYLEALLKVQSTSKMGS